MSQSIASPKPLFLSEEEALAMLDMCLMSSSENDSSKERAMLKLTDLVRRYLADGDEYAAEVSAEAAETTSNEPEAATVPIAALLHSLSDYARDAGSVFDVTMRQHTGRVYFGRRNGRFRTMVYAD